MSCTSCNVSISLFRFRSDEISESDACDSYSRALRPRSIIANPIMSAVCRHKNFYYQRFYDWNSSYYWQRDSGRCKCHFAVKLHFSMDNYVLTAARLLPSCTAKHDLLHSQKRTTCSGLMKTALNNVLSTIFLNIVTPDCRLVQAQQHVQYCWLPWTMLAAKHYSMLFSSGQNRLFVFSCVIKVFKLFCDQAFIFLVTSSPYQDALVSLN